MTLPSVGNFHQTMICYWEPRNFWPTHRSCSSTKFLAGHCFCMLIPINDSYNSKLLLGCTDVRSLHINSFYKCIIYNSSTFLTNFKWELGQFSQYSVHATGWTTVAGIFPLPSLHPGWLWSLTSLLFNEYQTALFLGKWWGYDTDHSPPFNNMSLIMHHLVMSLNEINITCVLMAPLC